MSSFSQIVAQQNHRVKVITQQQNLNFLDSKIFEFRSFLEFRQKLQNEEMEDIPVARIPTPFHEEMHTPATTPPNYYGNPSHAATYSNVQTPPMAKAPYHRTTYEPTVPLHAAFSPPYSPSNTGHSHNEKNGIFSSTQSLSSPVYSPMFSQSSPVKSQKYSPSSPVYSPTSPIYSPASP